MFSHSVKCPFDLYIWGIYPKVLDWYVGAVKSEFELDAYIKKKPKNLAKKTIFDI